MSILWPPPYYLLRDRIPFFLTLIYIYLYLDDKGVVYHRVSEKLRSLMGYGLIAVTIGCLGISLGLMAFWTDLSPIVGFRWSFPSPVEWSLFVLICTRSLMIRGLGVFNSYYLSLLMGLGGGWMYEILYGIPYWIRVGGGPWNWYKYNAVKIFLIEFQVFCIPLAIYILINRYDYHFPKYIKPLTLCVILWHMSNFWTAPFFHTMGVFRGNSMYSWVLRVPVMILLGAILRGVKMGGEKR